MLYQHYPQPKFQERPGHLGHPLPCYGPNLMALKNLCGLSFGRQPSPLYLRDSMITQKKCCRASSKDTLLHITSVISKLDYLNKKAFTL